MAQRSPVPIVRLNCGRPPAIVAESPAMKRVLGLVERVAPSPIPVLLLGETGSGKDVIARAIHAASRRGGAFVPMNCAAVPGTLAEDELFGHVRGAFTGATGDRRGLWAAANGGTLFLDEIGDLDLAVQAKLLRALEDDWIRPVGATVPCRVDVRIVAATHRDLFAAISEKRFREDLYHRLAGLTLAIPPLRERREDIVPLARLFLGDAPGEAVLSASAESWLQAQSWRGNVRELRQVMRRAAVLGGPVLTPGDLAGGLLPMALAPTLPPLFGEPGTWLVGRTWSEIEAAVITWAISHYGGIRPAARALGRSKSTLFDRARRLCAPPVTDRSFAEGAPEERARLAEEHHVS